MPSSLVHSLVRLAEPRPAALVWVALVGVVLLVPGSETLTDSAWLRLLEQGSADKVVHFLLFAALAALLGRWWSRTGLGAPLLAAAVAATVYGALTEALQMAVPGRSPEWLDLLADGVGALAGVALLRWLERRARRPIC